MFLDSSYDVLSLHSIKWLVDSNENIDMEFLMVYFDRISFLTDPYSYSFLLLTPILLRRRLKALLFWSFLSLSSPNPLWCIYSAKFQNYAS